MIDYLEVSSEKNRDNRFTKEDVLSVSGEYGIVNQIEFQGRSFAGASVSNYGVVENGDVVYTKSPLKSNFWNFCSILRKHFWKHIFFQFFCLFTLSLVKSDEMV